jgi:DNA-binding beta-propeller fold protein YncE
VWAQGQTFVTNYFGDSVTVYPRRVTGDIAPSYTILGQLGDGPHQIAINHSAGEVVVTNNISYSVAFYDWSSGVLKRTIKGPSTHVIRPTGVAVDEVNGEIYVANDWANNITVYDMAASGDAAPKRTIESANLSQPVGVAIDLLHNEIVVSNYGSGNSITTFDRLSSGDSAPTRVIQGSNTGLVLPQGVALDLVNDEIVVANSWFPYADAGAILVFRRTDAGDIAPIRRLEGNVTKLCNPISVALDLAVDELVVANSNFGGGSCTQSVTTYSRAAVGNTVPKQTIAGGLTTLYYPTSAAITSASSLTVKAKATASSVNGTNRDPVSYTITVTANGGPVFRVNLADRLPAGLTWTLSGPDAGFCVPPAAPVNTLTCSFGKLAKGQTKTIQVSAFSTPTSCPGITNQAAVVYNDGTADVTGSSPLAAITIKCK